MVILIMSTSHDGFWSEWRWIVFFVIISPFPQKTPQVPWPSSSSTIISFSFEFLTTLSLLTQVFTNHFCSSFASSRRFGHFLKTRILMTGKVLKKIIWRKPSTLRFPMGIASDVADRVLAYVEEMTVGRTSCWHHYAFRCPARGPARTKGQSNQAKVLRKRRLDRAIAVAVVSLALRTWNDASESRKPIPIWLLLWGRARPRTAPALEPSFNNLRLAAWVKVA